MLGLTWSGTLSRSGFGWTSGLGIGAGCVPAPIGGACWLRGIIERAWSGTIDAWIDGAYMKVLAAVHSLQSVRTAPLT